MVALIIAYSMTAFLTLVGLRGFYKLGMDKIPASEERTHTLVSFAFIAAAWGCAYLGGI